MLAANVIFALIWVFVLDAFTPGNVIAGFVVGFVLIWLCGGERARRSGYIRRTRGVAGLALFTLWELVKANLRVAYYTVTDFSKRCPAILAVPLRPGLSDTEITLLGNLITLTPGTLTLDVAEDRSAIFVHFMHVDDADAEVASIKNGFERRILEATR